ncbi:chemotaxis protein [Pseudomonas sp. TCU-HL1]|nr:methyl-accepting chemotaxis protein [Pseudomonas sp. TCU-HL1]AOE85894.1 chemotaxis protein [Pseudomonas sp. TCU-HL1]
MFGIKLSIKGKIGVLSGACILLTAITLVLFSTQSIERLSSIVSVSSRDTLKASSLTGMAQISARQAAVVRERFSDALVFGRTLVQQVAVMREQARLHGFGPAELRKALYDALYAQIKENREVLGVALVFDANALDGRDGDFIDTGVGQGNNSGRFASYASASVPSYSMTDSELADDGTVSSEWIRCPHKTKRVCVTEPYTYSYNGVPTLMSTVALPLLEGNKVIGVLSVDITLSELQRLLETSGRSIFDGMATVSLISPAGAIAAQSKNAESLGKGINALYPEHAMTIITKMKEGVDFSYSDQGALNAILGFAPVEGAANWGVVISVPDATYMKPSDELQRQLEEHRQSAIATQVTVGIMIFGVSLILLGLVARSIARPVLTVSDMVENIAGKDGDLTQRLTYAGQDELGKLVYWFNTFLDKLQPIVSQVSDSVGQTRQTAYRASQIASDTNSGMQQQFLEVDQVATAAQEMSATAQDVAQNASMAAQAMTTVEEAVNNGNQVIGRATSAIDSLVEEIEQAGAQALSLEQNSEQIGKVLDVIRSVAEQTNLLALNAAIEAARAGESGRGFAVVADEVRSLAQRTQTSVTEIQEVIERLQGGTQAVVKSMDATREEADKSVKHVQMAVAALQRIAEGIEAITGMNLQIASAAEEQSAVSEEVNRNVSAIRDVTERLARQALESSEISKGLDALADHQQRLMSSFRV